MTPMKAISASGNPAVCSGYRKVSITRRNTPAPEELRVSTEMPATTPWRSEESTAE